MEEIDELFGAAVRDGRIHGASVLARSTSGHVNISRSYGASKTETINGQKVPMKEDTPMRFASATKFLTSVMAMQCVERGEISLDDTLEYALPEVAKLRVIIGYDEEGKTIERDPTRPITLRHLLSHSSGVAYAMLDPLLIRFRTEQGRPVDQGFDTIHENFEWPLIYDPGEDWSYGPGLDWCTRLITRVSKKPAEEYLQEHLVKPLGLQPEEMIFSLLDYPEANARHADVVVRQEDGSFARDDSVSYWTTRKEPSGGQGIFCSPRAYFEVMHSVLADDGRILKPETRELLFEPALTSQSEEGLARSFVKLKAAHIGEPVPDSVKKSHSIAGLLTMSDCNVDDPPAWRRKGSLTWGGFTNVFWNVDPEGQLACLWTFHSKPFGDPICMDIGTRFEHLVYDMARQ